MEHHNYYKMFTKINQRAFLYTGLDKLTNPDALRGEVTTLNNNGGMKACRTGTIKALLNS